MDTNKSMDTVTSIDAKRTTTLERKPTTAWPPTRASTPSPAKKNYKSLPSLFSNFFTVNLCIFWQIEVISWPIFSTASCETLKLASSLLSQLTYDSLRNRDYGTKLLSFADSSLEKFLDLYFKHNNEPVFGSLSVLRMKIWSKNFLNKPKSNIKIGYRWRRVRGSGSPILIHIQKRKSRPTKSQK